MSKLDQPSSLEYNNDVKNIEDLLELAFTRDRQKFPFYPLKTKIAEYAVKSGVKMPNSLADLKAAESSVVRRISPKDREFKKEKIRSFILENVLPGLPLSEIQIVTIDQMIDYVCQHYFDGVSLGNKGAVWEEEAIKLFE